MTRRLFFVLIVHGAACTTARRTAAPPAPAARAAPATAALAGIDLHLGGFKMDGTRSVDSADDVHRLAYRLAEYLQAVAPFRSIREGMPPAASDTPSLRLDVWINADHHNLHSFIFDYLSLFPPVLGLFAPWWGDTEITVASLFTDAAGRSVAFYRADATDAYAAAFWTWYRTDFVEDAFAASYTKAFAHIAKAVANDAERIAALATPASAPPPPAETPPAASGLLLSPPAPEPPPFGIFGERPRPTFDRTFYGGLRLLGGIEGGPLYGFARVSSRVKDEYGNDVEIAAGNARQKGYRVALYAAPTASGWFWYPVFGFLAQNIDNRDFQEDLTGLAPAASTDIAAVCSDPDTGETIECGAPNTYALTMRSGYSGARAGYSVVAGSPNIELFLSLNAGLNVLEYRRIEVDIGAYSAQGASWAWLSSGALGMTYGLRLPKVHAALRVIFDYEWYRQFNYAEPVLFKGPVRYNAAKQKLEQPPLFVDAAQLNVWSFAVAGAIVF